MPRLRHSTFWYSGHGTSRGFVSNPRRCGAQCQIHPWSFEEKQKRKKRLDKEAILASKKEPTPPTAPVCEGSGHVRGGISGAIGRDPPRRTRRGAFGAREKKKRKKTSTERQQEAMKWAPSSRFDWLRPLVLSSWNVSRTWRCSDKLCLIEERDILAAFEPSFLLLLREQESVTSRQGSARGEGLLPIRDT